MLLAWDGTGIPCPSALVPTLLLPATRRHAMRWPCVQDGGGGKDREFISLLSRVWSAALKAISLPGGFPHVLPFAWELLLS